MNSIRKISHSFREFVNARPWLFLALVPILFYTLPTATPRHSSVMQACNKLVPTVIQAEVGRYEPAADKLFRSAALTVMIWAVFTRVGQDIELTAEA